MQVLMKTRRASEWSIIAPRPRQARLGARADAAVAMSTGLSQTIGLLYESQRSNKSQARLFVDGFLGECELGMTDAIT